MSEIIRGPRKPKRLGRKFQITKRDWKILTHRERERFKTLSYEDKKKINGLYAKVVMNVRPCKHRETISLKLKLDNGFTLKVKQCCTCRKVLKKTIYKNKGFGCPFQNPKNV